MKIKKLITHLTIVCTAIGVAACNGGNSSAGNSGSGQNDTTAPEILGYYTNWSTYNANYQPSNIPSQVDVILYAFAQVGDCANPNTLSPPKPSATMKQPALCYPSDSGSTFSGNQDWKLHSSDPWSDFYSYKDAKGNTVTGAKGNIAQTLKTGKKVRLSIGGWTLSAAIDTAINDQNRDTFAQSIIDFMKQAEKDAANNGVNNKFDGVDIDWEPNGNLWTLPATDSSNVSLTKTDLENYYQFLKVLKQKLTDNGYNTLSIAMTANPKAIKDVDSTYGGGYWSGISDLGVKLNMMTYDYNGQAFAGSCQYTQFNSPLYRDDSNPCNDVVNFNVDSSYQALANAGVPNSSIGIGIPAYGRAYALNNVGDVTATNPYALFNPANGNNINNVAVPDWGQVWTNRNILTGRAYGGSSTTENTTWTYVNDYFGIGQTAATASVNSLYPAFITYSSYNDAKNVMNYAKDKGLSGVMVWALDQDVQSGDYSAAGASLPWGTSSIIAGLNDGTNGKVSMGTKYVSVYNVSSSTVNASFSITPLGTSADGSYSPEAVMDRPLTVSPNTVSIGEVNYTVTNLAKSQVVSDSPPILQLALNNYGTYTADQSAPYHTGSTFTPAAGITNTISDTPDINSSDTVCVKIINGNTISSRWAPGRTYGQGCGFPVAPTPAPTPTPTPAPTPGPSGNYTLEVTNTGTTTGIQIMSITNGSAKIGQLDWLAGGAYKSYGPNTNPSVAAIEGASNLVAHWGTYPGGPEGDCSAFNFNKYTHIMINVSAKPACVVAQ